MHKNSKKNESTLAKWLLNQEKISKIHQLSTYKKFYSQINKTKKDLINLLLSIKKEGKLVLGYSTSTKSNVILQFCNINFDLIPFIGDKSSFKENQITPGSNNKIMPMEEVKNMKPHYFLVLPWSFKNDILNREKKYIYKNNVKFIFSLPNVEVCA